MRLRPLRNLVHVERLTETVSKGGILIPQNYRARESRKAVNQPDHFRARVLDVGPDVRELAEGDEVLVHTWAEDCDGTRRSLYTGKDVPGGGLLIAYPDDLVCACDAAEAAE